MRHYTRLSQKNYSIDTNFYPLGSCTMKYNPRACNKYAMLPGFLDRHPYASVRTGQGFMACMFELQEMLRDITGMRGISLSPLAGAQGEFTGVAMIRAYHDARGDRERTEILVPDAATLRRCAEGVDVIFHCDRDKPPVGRESPVSRAA